MNYGIESISFAIPSRYVDLRELARARGVEPAKFTRGIGQERMAVPAPDEDVVTLGAAAAQRALEGVDLASVRTVIFATESGIDQSKAAAIYVHRLLDLPANCRTVEVKQACCSSTSALQFGLATVAQFPRQRVLLVASDVARYGLGSPGEPTQGAGAVAMVLSAQPHVMTVHPEAGYFTRDVMDFWRPNYRDEALVDGKASIKVYLDALEQAWRDYQTETSATIRDFHHVCYHLPFTRMASKAHQHLARLADYPASPAELDEQVEPSLRYNRLIGNCYTASLYISLLSLLENTETDCAGKRIGLFSYGSGCMASFFSGTVTPGYRDALPTRRHRELLAQREKIDLATYESLYRHALPEDGSTYHTPSCGTRPFRLAGIEQHRRIYETVPQMDSVAHASPAPHVLARVP